MIGKVQVKGRTLAWNLTLNTQINGERWRCVVIPRCRTINGTGPIRHIGNTPSTQAECLGGYRFLAACNISPPSIISDRSSRTVSLPGNLAWYSKKWPSSLQRKFKVQLFIQSTWIRMKFSRSYYSLLLH